MSTVPSYPSLTKIAHRHIIDAINQYENRSRAVMDHLEQTLGADRSFGKGYMVSFPSQHDGDHLVTDDPSLTEQSRFVLKLCFRCIDGRAHQDCFVDQEVWVWEEAIRRGDSRFFAPIIAADRTGGWEVMQQAAPLGTLPGLHGLRNDGRMHAYQMRRHFQRVLRSRGWEPHDVEVMALNDRPVVIDYEDVYHQDVFSGLYMQSFKGFPGGMNYTPRSKHAFSEWSIERN
ncbi:hypothetical protein V5735_00115 (plasmid) [Haladaptatus sp. SPP-AMP-3]|uniref:hypothetical protein n=1 Tax=Haladaptatus sp. SPP-AMP-3 TaxID=3121295 RepID=UPI003C2C66D1